MRKKNPSRFLIITCVVVSGLPFATLAAPTSSAIKTLDAFYRDYLSNAPHSARHPAFSQAFLKDTEAQKNACLAKDPTDSCAWDADYIPYLGVENAAEGLTYQNARPVFSEPRPGVVKVTLHPGGNPAGTQVSTVTYHMVREKNTWAVDDIVIDNGTFSARKGYIKQ